MNRCSIPGCDGTYKANGFCNVHYMRWYRWGDPLHEPPARSERQPRGGAPLCIRFWSKVDFSDPDGCWRWTGALRHDYGEVWIDGRKSYAHRAAYELVYGPLDEDQVVRHRCDNPLCVRPDHLTVGTQAENMRDCGDRQRWRNQHAAGANNDPAAWSTRRQSA